MKTIHWKSLIWHVALPLAVGGLAALITSDSMKVYQTIETPPFAPPGVLFPIVWTILYLLMGISAYRIDEVKTADRTGAHAAYYVSLALNFFWSLLFFVRQAYLASFIWLTFLLIAIVLTVWLYSRIDRPAAWLQVPYLLWVTFAGILNFSIFLLN